VYGAPPQPSFAVEVMSMSSIPSMQHVHSLLLQEPSLLQQSHSTSRAYLYSLPVLPSPRVCPLTAVLPPHLANFALSDAFFSARVPQTLTAFHVTVTHPQAWFRLKEVPVLTYLE